MTKFAIPAVLLDIFFFPLVITASGCYQPDGLVLSPFVKIRGDLRSFASKKMRNANPERFPIASSAISLHVPPASICNANGREFATLPQMTANLPEGGK